MSSSPNERRHDGFTLVELLVVIAIIAILASLIFPAVSTARNESKTSQCQSNLSQIGTAFFAFANDNDGYLPRGDANFASNGNTYNWAKALNPYIATQNNATNGVVANKVFCCPAAVQPPASYNNDVWQYSVTYAVEEGDSATDANGIDGNGPRRLCTVQQPAKTIMVFDGVTNAGTYSASSSSSYTNAEADVGMSSPTQTLALAFRHRGNGSMNALFADGHVDAITWPSVASIILSGSSGSVWNGRWGNTQ
ncbi:MAG: type II secretion system protein [Chthoniobacteraceae bacterium]|jgi:prepilin-type N-terminal cleavage/methylation domain-containing protein/prepilin-type processing-associated H-X9-DG protein